MTDQKETKQTLINRIDTILARIEFALLMVSLGIMILIAFLQVILRNIFASGMSWGDMLLRQLVLWVGFIGASLATKENRHIKIDALYRVFGPRGKMIITTITNLFSALICGLLVRAAYVFVRDERMMGSKVIGIPGWIFMIIILIGFGIITFRFLIKAFRPVKESQSESQGD
jgi:TRAP-type C4-dicarboxylate transport system permease small subunit